MAKLFFFFFILLLFGKTISNLTGITKLKDKTSLFNDVENNEEEEENKESKEDNKYHIYNYNTGGLNRIYSFTNKYSPLNKTQLLIGYNDQPYSPPDFFV